MSAFAIRARPWRAAAIQLLAGAKLPVDDLAESNLEHFFFSGQPAAPQGIVGLELYGPVALLRSLVVDPSSRNTGLGSALVEYAEHQARASGVRAIYLLTTTAESFFAARGWRRTSREDAPPSIQETREFAHLCPASSAFMVKFLSPEN